FKVLHAKSVPAEARLAQSRLTRSAPASARAPRKPATISTLSPIIYIMYLFYSGGVEGRGGMGQRERRGRGRRNGERRVGRGLRRVFQPMIAVERRDDLHERPDRRELAALDPEVDETKRLGEPLDLKMNVALRRVEPPRVERPVDLPPHRFHADL